jgi:DNA segregation ATPase FtsK/SpoIIIE, S-DNA-T family
MTAHRVIGRPRAAQKSGWLPAGAVEFLRRRAEELGGLAVLALAGLLALALMSYRPGDPSFNVASTAAPANWLGRPGAQIAELLLPALGLGAIVLVLAPIAWSWRIMAHRGLPWFAWVQLPMLPLAAWTTATAAAVWPTPAAWPVPVGLGGWLGRRLFDLALPAAGSLAGDLAAVLVATLATVLALGFLVFALGISPGEWRAMAGAALRLGRVGRRVGGWVAAPWHGATAAANWLRDLRLPRWRRPAIVERAEPRLAGDAPRLAAEVGEPSAPRVVKPKPAPKPGKRAEKESQPALDLVVPGEWRLPPLNLLPAPKAGDRVDRMNQDALEQNAKLLESVLDDYGIRGKIIQVRPGPVVTLYELEPEPGLKSSRVIGLADDIARSMSAVSARVAVVTGRNVIGIELPNARRETVLLREQLSSAEFDSNTSRLPLALGKDIGGQPVIADLARMPHLLVAGTTGSGKSVAVNVMILSLLYRLSPQQCRLVLIDPKMLELNVYDGIPHLLAPVVTEPAKAVVALKWTVREMEQRYRAMSQLGVRNIEGFNQRLAIAREKGEELKRTVQTGFDPENGKPLFEEQPLALSPLPYIVVVVDELADLMMIAGKDIEAAIQRLAQMARAAGIHLILATQRPSVDVITGTIKANFPTRISFQVTSKIDSRTILGEQGAEQLLGQGDMLFMAGGGRITRVHGPYVAEAEVEKIVDFLKDQGEPEYVESVTADPEEVAAAMGGEGSGDDLYDRAVALVARERKCSTSFIQRHLQIGYNRAARIVDQMEAQGVVGQANHVGKREVLVGDH